MVSQKKESELGAPSKYSDANIKEMYDSYLNGKSITEITEEYELPTGSIYDLFQKINLPLLKQAQNRNKYGNKPERNKEICRLHYLEGVKFREIGEKFGGKDQTKIMYAWRKIKEERKKNKGTDKEIEEIIEKITS